MSELQVITLIVGFVIPFVFAGGGMVASALILERTHDRWLVYLVPAISACVPVLVLLCVVQAKAIGGIVGAALVCLLAWRGYRSEARPMRSSKGAHTPTGGRVRP